MPKIDAQLGIRVTKDLKERLTVRARQEKKSVSALVVQVAAVLAENGFTVGNVDATVLAQRPKLAPHIPQMRDNLAQVMGVSPDRVNVKATTEEGLGFTGSGEGMAAHAVALIEKT